MNFDDLGNILLGCKFRGSDRLRRRSRSLKIGLQRSRRAFQLGREPHDVDKRRAQIVADDVGEALDLFIRARQSRGALDDATLQVLVEGLELLPGFVEIFVLSATR